MSYAFERRLLQILVVILGAWPVIAGFNGLIGGLGMIGEADSRYRYLSGIELGLGAALWSTIPRIEQRTDLFRVITIIIVIGGLARLGAALAVHGDRNIWIAIAFELGATPLAALWRERIERMDVAAAPRYRGPWA